MNHDAILSSSFESVISNWIVNSQTQKLLHVLPEPHQNAVALLGPVGRDRAVNARVGQAEKFEIDRGCCWRRRFEEAERQEPGKPGALNRLHGENGRRNIWATVSYSSWLLVAMRPDLTIQQWEEIDRHLSRSLVLSAVRIYREATACGIAESKEAIGTRFRARYPVLWASYRDVADNEESSN